MSKEPEEIIDCAIWNAARTRKDLNRKDAADVIREFIRTLTANGYVIVQVEPWEKIANNYGCGY